MTRMILCLLFLVAVFCIIVPANAVDSQIPNASLKVTVRQLQDGNLEKGFHILELSCWAGDCLLTSITLNTCVESGTGKKAFYPGVQRSSTREGNLVVTDSGNTLLVKETGSDIGGNYTNNFRFQYDPPKKGDMITRLHGFSGGFVKNSIILEKVITVEYIPIKGISQILSLDCGVLAPGVE